jgi:hypothetical protein
MGLQGPPGPAGTSVTATFALSPGVGASPAGEFAKVVEKTLGPGNYVVFTTAARVGTAVLSFGGAEHKSLANDCELRDGLGGIIGASQATGSYTEFVKDYHEITTNGGISVPEGETRTVSLWCRSVFNQGEVGNTQMMVLRIGGFN